MKRWVLVIWLVCGLPGLVFGLEVRFKADAEAGGDMLTVGDVAELRPADKAGGLAAEPLFPAPEPGEQRCFQSRTLKAYVMAAAADPSEKKALEFSGAGVVCVRHTGRLVSADQIQSVIDKELRSALGGMAAERIGFRLRNRPDALSLPPGRVSYEVLFSDKDIVDSRQVSVIVKVDGRVLENLTFAGQVQALAPVVVTGQKLRRGTEISRTDVRMQPRNLAELERPCVALEEAVGKRLKRSLAVDQVIRRSDLERPVLVERREIVTIVFEKGALRISARGKATADGRKGEVIMVENMRSHRQVPCTVIGEGLTRANF
ncbi:MAG: flagellar basal body P-ring formation chaperone FlgA [Thermodesulfobacteriota bacterium]